MEHDKKLAFIQNMTHMALSHAATTQNVPMPTGQMSHEKMLSFVNQMAGKGLKFMATGGDPGLSDQERAKQLAGQYAMGTQNKDLTGGGFGGAISSVAGTEDKFRPTGVPIIQGTNENELNQASLGARSAINNQASLATTLGQNANIGSNLQNLLASQYQNQIAGNGPNPALASLNQATGQNVANQAALMASQRGAGSNVGLIARQAAQTGAAAQQQAVASSAIQQAQQQLAAQGNLQNLAANQIAQGQGAAQSLNQAQQGEQAILQNANTAYNNANISQQSNLNNVNAQIAVGNQNANSNMVGSILGGASAALPFLLAAKGGMVPKAGDVRKMAGGGEIVGMATQGPQSYIGQWLNNSQTSTGNLEMASSNNISTDIANPLSGLGNDVNAAGKALTKNKGSQQERSDVLTGAGENEMPQGGIPEPGVDPTRMYSYHGGLMKKGGNVKAMAKDERAEVGGDSLANDKVPAMLSEGEIVIPRHITMAKDAPAKAALFVARELKKRGRK